MTGDYVSDLRAFCTEWLKQNRGYDLIDHGFGSEHGGELTTVKLAAVLDELERLRAQVGEEEVSWAVCAGYDADGDEIYHSTAEEYAREAAAKGIPVTKWVTRVYPTTVYDMELNESGEWQEVGMPELMADERLAER